jgi:hypothetical protein
MVSPERPIVSYKLNGNTYRLFVNNAAKRYAEEVANQPWPTIVSRMFPDDPDQDFAPSYTSLAAVLWGATRKFHRRDLPDIEAIDELVDQIDESAEDAAELFTCMGAAIRGLTKQQLLKEAEKAQAEAEAEEEEDDEPEAEANGQVDAEADGAPKEDGEEKPKTPRKRTPSRSAAGKTSSSKDSAPESS